MSWTAPKTWATGELVTANDLNTQISGNFNYLKPRVDLPNNYLNNTGFTNLVGPTFTRVLNMTITYTHPSEHRLMLWFRSAYRTGVQNGEMRFTFRVTPLSGPVALQGDPTFGILQGVAYTPLTWMPLYCSHVVLLNAGTHTIEACGAAASGQGVDFGGPQHSQFGYTVLPVTV